jgi:hypothetical protein
MKFERKGLIKLEIARTVDVKAKRVGIWDMR